MNEPTLTASEKRYLEDLRRLPTSLRSRLLGWALELVPSVGLFSYGLLEGGRDYLVLGFLSLLYFSVWRMVQQLRGARMIRSIYEKRLAQSAPPDPR